MSSIDLATRINIRMYLLDREKGCNAFPRSTDQQIIQVLNELPTDKRHVKVPQDGLLCPTHVVNKKNGVSKSFFLSVLHDQTSVESL